MESLSKLQQNFCETAGVIGIFISVLCFIQHLVLMSNHWVNFIALVVYACGIITFIALTKKWHTTSGLIIASTAGLILFYLLFWPRAFLVLVFLGYTIIVSIIYYAGATNSHLYNRYLLRKEERKAWEGKI